ncbi:MAG: ArnT family glycosyltransferase [Anaerolineae bacterium]
MSHRAAHATRTRPRAHWTALVVMMVLFGQLLRAATELSATVDEGFHITSGYEYLRTGRMHLLDEHTPLAKALFAWPLFFVPDLVPPEAAAAYTRGDLIEVAQETTLAYRPLDRVIVAPRVAAALLTLLLAATIYRWASKWARAPANLLALTLCAFDPNFIAHGSLGTTDMGATACSFWAIWAGSQWLAHPTKRRWWIAALLLGLAQGAKLTALLVYPVLGIGVLVSSLASVKGGAQPPGKRIASYAGMVAISLLVLWALYGFEIRPVTGVLGGRLPVPAASHVERWLRLQENLAYGRESFLLGQNSMHGWLLYFPVAFLVKTPLPLLLLGLVAMAVMWRRTAQSGGGYPRLSIRLIPVVLFPALYALASFTSSLNIGYRHLLPIFPFLYVSIASLLCGPPDNRSLVQHHPQTGNAYLAGIVVLLCAWLAVGTLTVSPHYLAFFNALAGGADNGWRFLADSNTDWGQTYKALARYQQEASLPSIKLSSFTFYDPAAYGVDYEPIAPMQDAPPILPRRFNPESAIYAISATTLDGVPLPYTETYDWFRHRAPFARIGHVMFLYQVEPLRGAWVAQCTTPTAPLTEAALTTGLGSSPVRQIAFDCDQSWVVPGDSEPGWYARTIPEQRQLRWPDPDDRRLDLLPAWIGALPLEHLHLSYLQRRHGELPAFAMWTTDGDSLVASHSPIELAGTVTFLGFLVPDSVGSGAESNVITLWEVLQPPDRPLSIMLHLTDSEGTPAAIGDGLGFPIDQWRVGDRFAQRHSLTIPTDAATGPYTLRTGAYWLDTLQPLSDQTITAQLEIR